MASAVREKSFVFALQIVRVARELQVAKREYVLARQLMRPGTAIGALIREAEQAESRADFAHKLAIALKEACETQYWLELLEAADLLNKEDCVALRRNSRELIKLLTTIVKTTRKRSGTRQERPTQVQ